MAMGNTIFDSDPPPECIPVLRDLIARLEQASLFRFDGERDELHVWNGSATWNVVDVRTGTDVDVYSTPTPASRAQALALMAQEIENRRNHR